ncbi:ribosome maturation factor RimP [Lachnospiraceae bacterium RM5]|nr:ribosome maturation factor RimP [Lachnospiraceae bacterium RM5]
MSKREDYEKKTEELVLPLIDGKDFELVDIEYVKEGGNYYLRVYLDKEGGITIDDLEMVSRALSDKLDEKDFIDDAYVLELSSPGLDRPLKKDKDFERNKGKMVELKLYKALDGVKEFEGELKGYDEENILVMVDEEEKKFNRQDVALVRLKIEF